MRIPKLKKKSALFYLFAFLLPVLIMTVIYIIIGIYPFGKLSLLTIDLYHQYIDFLGYLRDFLLGGGSAFYSFSKALGGNMIGLFAYYLTSPLNLILVLFPKHMFSEAILVLSLLKIGFCGLTFSILLRKMFAEKKNLTVIFFSTCYALMSYNLVFQQNIMWLDGCIWLPIVVLGLYRLVTQGKPFLYAISLAIALISNYYIGYMLCIFSVLYFGYQMFLSGSRDHIFKSKREILLKIGKFLAASLLAGGLAAIILLPTFMALRTGKASFDTAKFSLNSNFEFTQLLQKMFIGEMDISLLHRGIRTTLPDIFSGLLTLLLTILYFCNKKITYREKAASGLFLGIMLMSIHIKAFDLIWHGFNTPIGFMYRNTFLISFLMVFFAYRCFTNLDGINTKTIFGAVFGYILLGIFVNNFALESLAASEIWLSIGVFSLYGLLMILYLRRGSIRPALVTVTIIVLCAELIINGALTLENLSYTSRSQFVADVEPLSEAVASIKNMDDSFYRMEKNFERTRNDAAMQNYAAISHSSSTADKHVVDILNKFGFRDDSNIGNIYNEGSTLPVNSLLGIKYLMTRGNTEHPYYDLVDLATNYQVYQNPYALSLGFAGGANSLSVSPEMEDPFMLQNYLFSALTNSQVPQVLSQLSATQKTENLTTTNNGWLTKYTRTDSAKEAYIEFTMTAVNDEEVYAFFPTDPISDSTCNIYVNGTNTRTYFDSNHLTYYDIINLGQFEKNETITIRVELVEEQVDFSEGLFYALDLPNMEEAYDLLSANPLHIEDFGNNFVKGSITTTSSKPVLFTTIPTDPGWKVKINGQEASEEQLTSSLDDTFIALNLGAGTFEVEFTYTPPGFTAGLLITGFCLLVLIGFGIFLLIRKRHKRAAPPTQEEKKLTIETILYDE